MPHLEKLTIQLLSGMIFQEGSTVPVFVHGTIKVKVLCWWSWNYKHIRAPKTLKKTWARVPARRGSLGFIKITTSSSSFLLSSFLLLLSFFLLLDLSCGLQIPVGTAGLQPRAPDLSGHYRTSTASSRSQWALPDLNRELKRISDRRPE